MSKVSIQDEIRRITNETAAAAAAKALEVAELAKQKAAEVSTNAIAEALKAATLAATRAAEAAAAAAAIAAATSKDLEYIKKDIADTKTDIKAINEKLDNKYLTKVEFTEHIINKEKDIAEINKSIERLVTTDQFSTVRNVVYGLVSVMLTSVVGGLMYLLIHK